MRDASKSKHGQYSTPTLPLSQARNTFSFLMFRLWCVPACYIVLQCVAA